MEVIIWILRKIIELRHAGKLSTCTNSLLFIVVNKQMDPLSSSPAESDISKWDKSWAESSLSENPTANQHFYDGSEGIDDASSVLTTSTMQMSEYQQRVLATDAQLNAKVPASILKKK